MKKLLVVGDALSAEGVQYSWDNRARAHDAIAHLGEHEVVVTSWEGRYVEPIADEVTQNVDLVIVPSTIVWVQDWEDANVPHEDAYGWVRNLFTRIVASNRNAQILTVVNAERDMQYQRQEELRILLWRQFGVYS